MRASSFLVLALAGAACSEPARRPNVVLVTVDTLRADHLSLYGHERDTSPFLTELAADSHVFENAVSQCGTTPQSFSSMMTGLYPFTDRIVTMNDRFVFLRRGTQTLASVLSEAGYTTHAITASVQTSRVTGLDLGFQTFDPVPEGAASRKADELTDRALAWLAEERDAPFFLWLHYVDPHHPYKAPPEYAELWKDQEPAAEGETRRYRYDPKHDEAYPLSDGDVARLGLNYDREVRFTDDQLRRLFEGGLEPLFDRTVVVVSADHGESLGTHKMVGHNDLFEPILHVPLVLRLPDGRASRIAASVMLVDLFPTLLELTGVPLLHDVRGRSLCSLMEGRAMGDERLRVAEYPDHRALYFGRHKQIERTLDGQHRVWVFDLKKDRAELRDVSHKLPRVQERFGELASKLDERSLGPDPDAADGEMPAVTPEQLRELHALGY